MDALDLTQKLIVRDTVESSSSDPSFAGFIEIEAHCNGVRLRWEGAATWARFEWWELLLDAREPSPSVTKKLAEWKEDAREEWFSELAKCSDCDDKSALAAAYRQGVEDGRKLILIARVNNRDRIVTDSETPPDGGAA